MNHQLIYNGFEWWCSDSSSLSNTACCGGKINYAKDSSSSSSSYNDALSSAGQTKTIFTVADELTSSALALKQHFFFSFSEALPLPLIPLLAIDASTLLDTIEDSEFYLTYLIHLLLQNNLHEMAQDVHVLVLISSTNFDHSHENTVDKNIRTHNILISCNCRQWNLQLTTISSTDSNRNGKTHNPNVDYTKTLLHHKIIVFSFPVVPGISQSCLMNMILTHDEPDNLSFRLDYLIVPYKPCSMRMDVHRSSSASSYHQWSSLDL